MPFDHFNLVAGFYDRVGQFQVSEQLLGWLDLSPRYFLLDVGGGTGRVAAALRSMVRDVVVADISRGMLRHASDKGLATICAPAESLPFLYGSFERIIMVDAYHHVFDQSQTARELLRVLAPGGRIAIIEPNIHKPIVRGIAIGEKVLLMRSHFLAGDKIAALFTDLGVKTTVYYEGLDAISIVEKVRGM